MGERAVYCGNYEYEMPERDIRKLFEEYGRVNRIDMKTGYVASGYRLSCYELPFGHGPQINHWQGPAG